MKYPKMNKAIRVAIPIVLAVSALLYVEFQNYVRAIAWHSRYGGYVDIGKQRVKLPFFWWEATSDAYDTTVLMRASIVDRIPGPQVTIGPTLPGQMKNTDQAELATAQAIVDLNQRQKFKVAQMQLVTIKAKTLTLYCTKAVGATTEVSLHCTSANVPYFFSFHGPSKFEKEAESVLATIEPR